MVTVAQIRECAIANMPYLARALFSLTPVASHDVPVSMLCDAHWRVYYNPDELCNYDHNDCVDAATRLCREVARLLQSHPKRLSALLPTGETRSYHQQVGAAVSTALANHVVGYEETNATCLCDLPGWESIASHPRMHTLEHVYRTVCQNLKPPEREPEQESSSAGQGASANSGASSQRQESPDDQGAPNSQPPESMSNEGSEEQKPAPLQPREKDQPVEESGSCTDGEQRSWELPPPKPPETGQEGQGNPAQASQQPINEEALREDIANRIQHMHAAGQGHHIPHGATTWAKRQLGQLDVNKPRDLTSLLQGFAETQAGYQLHRHDGRNRRQQQISAYSDEEISMARDFAPKIDILVVLDTSGSMGDKPSYIALKYIAKVLQSLDIHHGAHMYTGECHPRYWGRITPQSIDELTIDGRGGTNMPAVIEEALETFLSRGGSTNLVLCVTDGETPWHFREPLPVPLVIAVVPIHNSKETLEAIYSDLAVGADCDTPRPPEWSHITVIDVQEAKRSV